MNQTIDRIFELNEDVSCVKPWEVFAEEQVKTGHMTERDRVYILAEIEGLLEKTRQRTERITDARIGFLMFDALKKRHLGALLRADYILGCFVNGVEKDKVIWRFIWRQFYFMIEADFTAESLLNVNIPV